MNRMRNTAWADASPTPFWLDTPDRPAPRDPLAKRSYRADLAIVGGGFSGLWTAVLAKERNPDLEVMLLEGGRLAWAATGRNGGFCSDSLTHGYVNGLRRFPEEIDTLVRLGEQNLDEIEHTVKRYDIGCDFTRTGEIAVAVEPYQVEELRNGRGQFLDRDAVQARLNSPTFLAGSFHGGTALVNPARLAWGLASTAEQLGVKIAENTSASRIARARTGVELTTDNGATIHARRVALGTNAFPSLIRRVRLHTVPVYDYVLVTEPLSQEQMNSIGWGGREGFGDVANQFHYYRLTSDNRVLWGGYDAVYHYGRKVKDSYDRRETTFSQLAANFDRTFPQLEGIRFTHAWGGAIDTCTRFCAFYGSALGGNVTYALGFTGLGVGATRFGANVMLDLLDVNETERTGLQMVRSKPLPFPPEPFAYLAIQATRTALARADRNQGKRNLWLQILDRAGLGFDS